LLSFSLQLFVSLLQLAKQSRVSPSSLYLLIFRPTYLNSQGTSSRRHYFQCPHDESVFVIIDMSSIPGHQLHRHREQNFGHEGKLPKNRWCRQQGPPCPKSTKGVVSSSSTAPAIDVSFTTLFSFTSTHCLHFLKHVSCLLIGKCHDEAECQRPHPSTRGGASHQGGRVSSLRPRRLGFGFCCKM
jgi:hypothetical protein